MKYRAAGCWAVTALLAGLLTLLLGLTTLPRRTKTSPLPAPARPRPEAKPAVAFFQDIAAPSGIRFRHDTGARGRCRFLETLGSGCALWDYDDDGCLDILLLQAGPVPGTPERALWDKETVPRNRLYHNQGDGTFRDVTDGSGLENTGYAMGVAVGDYDNDGDDDLFLTAYGGIRLFRNERGTGRFQDVTAKAGMATAGREGLFPTSAAFGDYDNDGWLDLYVCYTPWALAKDRPCRDMEGRLDYCIPDIFAPGIHQLYRNNGNGSFTDVTQGSGIARARGRGLAVAWLDYDEDGDQDIFVANDRTPQFLWRNNGTPGPGPTPDGAPAFTEVAAQVGCAYEKGGKVPSGMGIGVGDYDNDGREDLFLTNFSLVPNCLWRWAGEGLFDDVSAPTGVARVHWNLLSFGCEFFDFDADGWRDLVIANGHIQVHVDELFGGVTYREPMQLLHNERGQEFRAVERELGDMRRERVSRGLAVGDVDNDGRLDVLVNNQNAAPDLFHNRVPGPRHWIAFKTRGTRSNRDGYHARLTLFAAGRRQVATVRAGSSYLSVSDRRLYFGLGDARRVERVEILWPSGMRQVLRNLAADAIYAVTEGKGITAKQRPRATPLGRLAPAAASAPPPTRS
jgi:hypothetical protein